MALFIEISGPAGAGKSTLYRKLNSTWSNKLHWIPAHKLLPTKRYHLKHTPKKYILNKIKKTFFNIEAIDSLKLLEAGERFVELNPELNDIFWNNIYYKQKTNLIGKDFRFDKSNHLYFLVQRLQNIIENKTKKIALIDEGPSKIIDVLSNSSISAHSNLDEIEKCIALLPLPSALIYLETNTQENVQRLLKRNYQVRVYKDLSIEQLADITQESKLRKQIVNNFFKIKNIPILYLDSSLDVNTNSLKTLNFLDNLKF